MRRGSGGCDRGTGMKTSAEVHPIRPNAALSVLVLCLSCLGTTACGSRKSPDALDQYGVHPGQTAVIEVEGIVFHIPPEYRIALNSREQIRKGHADHLSFSLNIADPIAGRGPATPGKSTIRLASKDEVLILIHRDNPEETKLTSPDERPSSGNANIYGLQFASGNASWVSIRERTPKGYPIHMFCSVNPNSPNLGGGMCRSTFDLRAQDRYVQVEWYFSSSAIPHWAVIYKSVLNAVTRFASPEEARACLESCVREARG